MATLHRARQNGRTEFSGETCRQRRFKEYPDVSAAPGA